MSRRTRLMVALYAQVILTATWGTLVGLGMATVPIGVIVALLVLWCLDALVEAIVLSTAPPASRKERGA